MSKEEVVLGIPKLEEDECESSLCSGCVLRKFDHKAFGDDYSGLNEAFPLVNRSEAVKVLVQEPPTAG
jgi:hypothetical protein